MISVLFWLPVMFSIWNVDLFQRDTYVLIRRTSSRITSFIVQRHFLEISRCFEKQINHDKPIPCSESCWMFWTWDGIAGMNHRRLRFWRTRRLTSCLSVVSCLSRALQRLCKCRARHSTISCGSLSFERRIRMYIWFSDILGSIKSEIWTRPVKLWLKNAHVILYIFNVCVSFSPLCHFTTEVAPRQYLNIWFLNEQTYISMHIIFNLTTVEKKYLA